VTERSGLRWYVVQTHPHAEAKAEGHLGRQGFSTYLPRYLKRRRHARKTETVVAPLFPRYAFVAINLATQRWRSIFSTVGVSRLVCQGDYPVPVSDGVVDALRQREDASGIIRLPARSMFKPGQAVQVVDGVFATCLGLFESMSDDERVLILLDLLGRRVRVTLNADSIAAA
jgi:transcriptional antiterminator RfaH